MAGELRCKNCTGVEVTYWKAYVEYQSVENTQFQNTFVQVINCITFLLRFAVYM